MNAERGEVALTVRGRTYPLCLTMGGLAALEHAFGAADLAALGTRLRAPSGADARIVLRILLDGAEIPERDLDWDGGEGWLAAARACAECFRLAFA